MTTKLSNLWLKLRYSYWFVPTFMMAGAIGLSFAMNAIDLTVKDKWVRNLNWLQTVVPAPYSPQSPVP